MRSISLRIALAAVIVCAAWTASSVALTNARELVLQTLRFELQPDLPVAVSARLVCRLAADNPSAAEATVLGVDGAATTVVDGTMYWFFGDTFRQGPGGRRDVIPAALATSKDFDASDCIVPTFKADENSIVQPMFPRLDETTAWPDGVLPLPDGSILFYTVKVHRQSPTEWHIGAIGLGVLPSGTLDGVRLVETIWSADANFPGRITGARSPIQVGDDVLVYISTEAGNFLARAPLARIADGTAYTYWDGVAWTPRQDEAMALWPYERSDLPADNGLSVAYDDGVGKWVALYNASMSHIQVRTADHPWGPWSAPITWFDCASLMSSDVYPFCYSSALHHDLTPDDVTRYVTFSNPDPYDVALIELRLGVAIHAWLGADALVRYAAAPPDDSYVDQGVAFYASGPALVTGLAPIYEDRSQAGYRYTFDPPAHGGVPAFFAYREAQSGAVPTQPVYEWERNGMVIYDTVTHEGWVRGEIAFHVPCPYTTSEATTLACAP